jgi:hypothetical protein
VFRLGIEGQAPPGHALVSGDKIIAGGGNMLEKKIYDDYVQSLKSGQKQKAQFLNFVRAGLKNAAISLKKDALDDTEVLAALKKNRNAWRRPKKPVLPRLNRR